MFSGKNIICWLIGNCAAVKGEKSDGFGDIEDNECAFYLCQCGDNLFKC